jgi:hypothetical protein
MVGMTYTSCVSSRVAILLPSGENCGNDLVGAAQAHGGAAGLGDHQMSPVTKVMADTARAAASAPGRRRTPGAVARGR